MTKVLLVEDDNNLREIYEARLAAEGYEISTAKDGEDALAVAKQVKPELIISDVMMPRISGFEMLDILRNTDGLKHVKVIMLTALGQSDDKTRADNLGADRYLVKSQVTLEDIVKAADELLNPDNTEQPATNTDAQQPGSPEDTSPTAPDISDGTVPAPTETVAAPGAEQQPTQPAIPTPVVEPVQEPTPAQQPVAPEVTQPAPQPEQPQPVVENQAPAQQPAVAVQPTPLEDTETSPSDNDEPLIQMPPQPDATEAVAAATASSATTTEQESAAVAQQIEDFANTPAPVMPEQATPEQPVIPTPEVAQPAPESNEPQAQAAPGTPDIPAEQATPAPEPPTPDAAAAVSNNDSVIQEAVDNLSNLEVPTTPEVAPVETTQSGGEDGQVAGKKVIRPISQPEAETAQLETLLAQEQMQENLDKGVTGEPVVGSNESAAPEAPAAAPIVSTEQAAPAQPQAIDSPQIPVQPEPGGVFTPNQNGDANENAL